ncbi:MAG: hypothetical protein ACREA4_01410 [Nitrososphaera sp.]
MLRLAAIVLLGVILAIQISEAYAHFFGATKEVDRFQIVFMPTPSIPLTGSNSTRLNFSVLENGTNILSIYSAVIISDKKSGETVGQLPYKLYEFSDITIPYTFHKAGDYTVTLQTRISGDEKYQANPLEANFDLVVEDPERPAIRLDELMLFYVTPAAVAIAGIVVYLHAKKKP